MESLCLLWNHYFCLGITIFLTIFSLKSLVFLTIFSLKSHFCDGITIFASGLTGAKLPPFPGYPFDGKIKVFRLGFPWAFTSTDFLVVQGSVWITCVRKITNHQLLRGHWFLSPGNPAEPWWRWGLSTEILPEPCFDRMGLSSIVIGWLG